MSIFLLHVVPTVDFSFSPGPVLMLLTSLFLYSIQHAWLWVKKEQKNWLRSKCIAEMHAYVFVNCMCLFCWLNWTSWRHDKFVFTSIVCFIKPLRLFYWLQECGANSAHTRMYTLYCTPTLFVNVSHIRVSLLTLQHIYDVRVLCTYSTHTKCNRSMLNAPIFIEKFPFKIDCAALLSSV